MYFMGLWLCRQVSKPSRSYSDTILRKVREKKSCSNTYDMDTSKKTIVPTMLEEYSPAAPTTAYWVVFSAFMKDSMLVGILNEFKWLTTESKTPDMFQFKDLLIMILKFAGQGSGQSVTEAGEPWIDLCSAHWFKCSTNYIYLPHGDTPLSFTTHSTVEIHEVVDSRINL